MAASVTERRLTFTIPALPVAANRKDPATGRMKPDPTKPPRLKLVGYYTKGARPDFRRLKEYHAWKDHVRRFVPARFLNYRANDAGSRLRVDVTCFFHNGTHNDAENVRKAIVDAICTEGDKWVAGAHDFPQYDSECPRVEVTLTWWEEGDPLEGVTAELPVVPEAS